MKNTWMVVFLLSIGTVAWAADDVVFATSEDASAFDTALKSQQVKHADAKPALNSMDSVDVRGEVAAAKKNMVAPEKGTGSSGSTISGRSAIAGAASVGSTALSSTSVTLGAPAPANPISPGAGQPTITGGKVSSGPIKP